MWNGIGWYGFIGPTTSTTDISLVASVSAIDTICHHDHVPFRRVRKTLMVLHLVTSKFQNDVINVPFSVKRIFVT